MVIVFTIINYFILSFPRLILPCDGYLTAYKVILQGLWFSQNQYWTIVNCIQICPTYCLSIVSFIFEAYWIKTQTRRKRSICCQLKPGLLNAKTSHCIMFSNSGILTWQTLVSRKILLSEFNGTPQIEYTQWGRGLQCWYLMYVCFYISSFHHLVRFWHLLI